MHKSHAWQCSYSWHIGVSLLAGHVVAIVLGVTAWLYWQSAPAHAFIEARQHWIEQPVPRYRLVIERPLLNCTQDVIVQHEQIVAGSEENTCPIPTLTVTDLFDRIARLDGMENVELFTGSGCGCEAVLHATVTYDEELGYPVEVGIADQRTIDWHKTTCWQHLLMYGDLPDCPSSFFIPRPRMTTISLTPLP